MYMDQNSGTDKAAPIARGWRNAVIPAAQAQLASRLAAVRAEISSVLAAPYGPGCAGPHRRRRDEYILQALAADIHARLIEARTA
jgi:hypothetical protein